MNAIIQRVLDAAQQPTATRTITDHMVLGLAGLGTVALIVAVVGVIFYLHECWMTWGSVGPEEI